MCTLLGYSYRSFSYTTLSIVVERYSIDRVFAADYLIETFQQLKVFCLSYFINPNEMDVYLYICNIFILDYIFTYL